MNRYTLTSKQSHPEFNYLVRSNDNLDYYLFEGFNDAVDKLKEVSLSSKGKIGLLYEPYFNTKKREWYAQNSFTSYDGELEYHKFGEILLHIKFYVDAGEWLNPLKEEALWKGV